MDERPETGGEWMSLVNRRLARLERRLRSDAVVAPTDIAAYLVPEGEVQVGWEVVPDLVAPAGWMYVRWAPPDVEI